MNRNLSKLPSLNILALLKRYRFHPNPRLGQNFLVDEEALQRVATVAEIGSQDVVLEIGAGLGSLTRYLAQMAKWVVAVEIDPRFLPPLREVLAPFANVHLAHGDILRMDPTQLFQTADISPTDYLVVANIPYYITSALIRHLLETPKQPRRLTLTVQREVAERICAQAGELNLLALSVQVYGDARIAAHLPASAFYPVPKVDSAVVRVEITPFPKIAADKRNIFFQLIKAGFSQKRKTLRNALAGGMGWPASQAEAYLLEANIAPNRRAQTLTLAEWSTLTEVISSQGFIHPASGKPNHLSPPQDK